MQIGGWQPKPMDGESVPVAQHVELRKLIELHANISN